VRDDLSGLGPQGFERLCQALAAYVLGHGIEVFGAGPDGGREAAFAGLQHYPASQAPWTGYGVLQVKFKEKLLGTGSDTTWLRKHVKAELTAWADSRSSRVRDGQRPEYLIVATNVPLSAVPRTGGKDRIGSLIAEFAPQIGLKDWRVWDAVQIGTFLDAYPDVRRAFAAMITPSEVLAALRDKLDSPPEVSVVLGMPAIRPGQPGNEQAFMPVYSAAGGSARLGQPLGEVQDDGTGFVQYFDGGPAGQPAVICAGYRKVPVAVAGEIWNALQAIGGGAPGSGTAGAGMPVAANPAAAFIGEGCDYVQLAGGSWGPGRLFRAGDSWAWRPEISFDSEAFRDRDTHTGRDSGMDLRLRVAGRIPVAAAGLRVTSVGRARMLDVLQEHGLIVMMSRLVSRLGLNPAVLSWAESPEPAGRNNSMSACYQTSATGHEGRPALSGWLWFTLPTGVIGDIRSIADLRISFDAIRPATTPTAGGQAVIPAELQITAPELLGFLAQGWQVTMAVLPLCAIPDPAGLLPAGAPHLELYITNERRPNSGDQRQVRTLDMINLTKYGQPRQDPPGDLSVGVTTPLGLAGNEIKYLVHEALDRLAEDFGFTPIHPATTAATSS
jgi:hypothetical protein